MNLKKRIGKDSSKKNSSNSSFTRVLWGKIFTGKMLYKCHPTLPSSVRCSIDQFFPKSLNRNSSLLNDRLRFRCSWISNLLTCEIRIWRRSNQVCGIRIIMAIWPCLLESVTSEFFNQGEGMHSDAYTLEMRYYDITRMLHDIMRDIMHMLWRHFEKCVKNIVDRSIDYFMAIAICALCNKMVRKYAPWWIFNILAFLEAPRDELSRDEPLRDEPSLDERVHVHVHRHDAAVVDDATVHAEAVAVVDAAAVASIDSSVISAAVIDANATA